MSRRAASGWLMLAAAAACAVPNPVPRAAWAADPAPMSAPDTWKPGTTAELVLLDKLRAQPVTLTVAAGQSTAFESLTVAMTRCVFRPPDLPANAAAFLEITEKGAPAPVFRGWILSNTPAVSQLEHPVYDLRVVSCR